MLPLPARRLRSLAPVLLLGSAALPSAADAQVVRTGIGVGGAVVAARDAFRLDLGGGNVGGAHGLFADATGARREITWDDVPDNLATPNDLPGDYFDVTSPRGVRLTTPGTGFRVSDDDVLALREFNDINPAYAFNFEDFSPIRLFTTLGSNVLDVAFFVPGTTTPALTRGFGAIFSDVDLENTTSIEYFDAGGALLFSAFAPGGSSDEIPGFLGVSFATPVVARVRITLGNTALGPGVADHNGHSNDLVVLDDFIYAEPTAVPEPATWALVAAGLAVAGAVARRRAA